MIRIELLKEEDVEHVARFISKINKNPESHIGYCGQDGQEIAFSLREIMTDVGSNCFVLAYEQDKLIGVLGFDADLENHSAEIWGPFLKEHKWDIIESMWPKMIALLPKDVNTLHMFPNLKNKRVLNLARHLDFKKHSEETILRIYREEGIDLIDAPHAELTPPYFSEIKQLHDKVFPGTYYSGQQIIDRLNEYRKVFIIRGHNDLAGYIYVEAEPEFGNASIEFFAVHPSMRGNGIGRKLLNIALKWLFTFESIDSITLCVNSKSKNAINLYKKVGFLHIYDLCFFTKETGMDS